MQSSWAFKSPLRWESDQSPFQSRVKPASEAKHAEEEVRRDLSVLRTTEEGAPLSLSVDNLIAEEEILSSLSAENFSDLSVLSERLKEIELLEKLSELSIGCDLSTYLNYRLDHRTKLKT